MRRFAFAAILILALTLSFIAGAPNASASRGCRAFGQELIASEAHDETPGVGDEASTFAPANDDVAFFKHLSCG
jgi:hypothetical protein